jgi:hypothetical protein
VHDAKAELVSDAAASSNNSFLKVAFETGNVAVRNALSDLRTETIMLLCRRRLSPTSESISLPT